jgi:hypothetical protein
MRRFHARYSHPYPNPRSGCTRPQNKKHTRLVTNVCTQAKIVCHADTHSPVWTHRHGHVRRHGPRTHEHTRTGTRNRERHRYTPKAHPEHGSVQLKNALIVCLFLVHQGHTEAARGRIAQLQNTHTHTHIQEEKKSMRIIHTSPVHYTYTQTHTHIHTQLHEDKKSMRIIHTSVSA